MKQHKTPCRECPFRRRAAPGWLGGFTPAEFKHMADQELPMPCHLRARKLGAVEIYFKSASDLPQCAGRAIHWANQIKQPRVRGKLLELPKDEALVFTWPHEFFNHHNSGPLKETR